MQHEPLQALSPQAHALTLGLYQHYKGNQYQVLGIARHSETLEEMVVYQALYGSGDIWIRPVALFCGSIQIQGQTVARFSKI